VASWGLAALAASFGGQPPPPQARPLRHGGAALRVAHEHWTPRWAGAGLASGRQAAGGLFGLLYLFSIYFKHLQQAGELTVHTRTHADIPSQRVAFRWISSVITACSVVIWSDRLANHQADQ
jgi:hypothetical protein